MHAATIHQNLQQRTRQLTPVNTYQVANGENLMKIREEKIKIKNATEKKKPAA